MTEQQIISKIQHYIDLTAVPYNQYYDIPGYILCVLFHGRINKADALQLAFEYGRAKGYRQGKNERKKA